tara:strand:- start:1788 stop:3605 length:1818 start_codon:yes stop_codon:yes gene_type:complete
MTKHSDLNLLEETPFKPPNYNRSIGLDIPQLTFFAEHRSGWNYVSECFEKLHKENGYKLIDFIEKPWGWNAIDYNDVKGIYYNNQSFYIPLQEIKNINNMEYTYLPECGVLFWNGEEWQKSKLITQEQVEVSASYGVMNEYWVGILHNPPNIPEWFDYNNSPQEIIKREDFQKSLEYCRGIYVFSLYLKEELLKLGGWPCPINVITHPINQINKKWCPSNYSYKLVQVGYWLRSLSSIWEVNVENKWEKIWINRAPYAWDCFNRQVHAEKKLKTIIENKVEVLSLENDEYDALLQNCIIFLDLYDSSINNSVLEAIIRHTPIVINKIKPIVEILGDDYPLFYTQLSDVSALLTHTNIVRAHEHLKKIEQSGVLYNDYFLNNIKSQSILTQKTKYDGPVISMGVDCLPRAMTCKFGFKKNKSQGGLTMPFDLAWHDYPVICELLKNDFKDYLDPCNLFINENNYIQHRIYGTLFNHESDSPEKTLKFMRNDCADFISRYNQRIDNLYATIENNDNIVFVLHYKEYPHELANIVRKKWPNKNFVILTLNTPYFHESHQSQPTNIETPLNNILFFTIRYPCENYVWYENQDPVWENKINNILSIYLDK